MTGEGCNDEAFSACRKMYFLRLIKNAPACAEASAGRQMQGVPAFAEAATRRQAKS